ncbi:MAG: phosphotransferase [Rhodobacteraceae bacterium]|nr:phosphotransferase [Paracoccaceae bacterium]
MDVVSAGGLQAALDPVAPADAAAFLAARYGIAGRLRRMATEKDDTFHVDAGPTGQFVLKIANAAEDAAEIDLQVAALAHVALSDPSLPVPRVVPDVAGAPTCLYEGGRDGRRIARLMTYLEGTPLDRTTSTLPERRTIGRLCGRLRLAMAGFSHRAEGRLLAWDTQRLPGLAPLLAEIGDRTQHRMLAEGMARFAEIEAQLPGLRTQVLHNDFNKSNLIVNHGHPDFVTGIIDFGDTVRTAIAVDLSTAMMNQMPAGAEEPMMAGPEAVLAGYIETADLTGDEIAILPMLMMGRVVTRALISVSRAQRFPENADYILRHTAQCWYQLDWFLARSTDDIATTFDAYQTRAIHP